MIESDWDKLCDHTDELIATGRYPGRYEAMLEAQRRNLHLDRTPPGMTAMTPTARPASTGNAEACRRVPIANPRLRTQRRPVRPPAAWIARRIPRPRPIPH